MTSSELLRAIASKQTTVLEAAIGSVFAKSIESGDYQKLAFLLDRAIGKAPTVEPGDEDVLELQNLSNTELLRLVRDLMPQLEKKPE